MTILLALLTVVFILTVYFYGKTRTQNAALMAEPFACMNLSGVTHAHNGVKAQDAIRHCHVGEELELIPDPKNRFDNDAVRVCRKNGDQVGWWPAETVMAGDWSSPERMMLADFLRRGCLFRATVEDLDEFTPDDNHGKPILTIAVRLDGMAGDPEKIKRDLNSKHEKERRDRMANERAEAKKLGVSVVKYRIDHYVGHKTPGQLRSEAGALEREEARKLGVPVAEYRAKHRKRIDD